ncbi:MAG: transglutaminase-like cysteine peptidase [Candidatus Paceibacterota bacterium]
MTKFFTTLGFMLSIIMVATPVLGSAAEPTGVMVAERHTTSPDGHYKYCRRNPADCQLTLQSLERLPLTAELRNQLIWINTQVNRGVTPVTDREAHGVEDYWQNAGEAWRRRAGDCEEYVILKREFLHNLGLPMSALLLTVVKQSNGEGHAVLTVRTDRGDLVLDNLTDVIKDWRNTPYQFLKRQSPKNPGAWELIADNHQLASQ